MIKQSGGESRKCCFICRDNSKQNWYAVVKNIDEININF